MHNKKKILLMADWYAPGFKAGGPIRSCVNFVEHMKDDYDVFVYTTDRDLGDTVPYQGIETDKWIHQAAGVQIYYASPNTLGWKNDLKIAREWKYHYVYLNSMYSRIFTIYPILMKRFGLISSTLVLSPRGMLKKSALSFKPAKKKVFLILFRLMGLHKYTRFHATDLTEAADIEKYFGKTVSVTNIANFPGFQKTFMAVENKRSDYLKIIFVGRIHPIKNLHFLLNCLHSIKANIHLTIVAAIEDGEYWKLCEKLIQAYPKNIEVTLISDVPHHQLEEILSTQHLFCLPTQGENFGHAIFEALAAGRPVLISDQTPWRDLENHKAGWDVPLNDMNTFIKHIEYVAAMNQEELNSWCESAWEFCNNYLHQSDIKQQYRKLFN